MQLLGQCQQCQQQWHKLISCCTSAQPFPLFLSLSSVHPCLIDVEDAHPVHLRQLGQGEDEDQGAIDAEVDDIVGGEVRDNQEAAGGRGKGRNIGRQRW